MTPRCLVRNRRGNHTLADVTVPTWCRVFPARVLMVSKRRSNEEGQQLIAEFEGGPESGKAFCLRHVECPRSLAITIDRLSSVWLVQRTPLLA